MGTRSVRHYANLRSFALPLAKYGWQATRRPPVALAKAGVQWKRLT